MKHHLWTYARKGLIALGLAGAMAAPAVAGPAGMAGGAAPAATTSNVIPIQSTEPDRRSGNSDGIRFEGRNWDNRHFKRRHWRNNHGNNWPRRHFRRNVGPNIYFGLGLAPTYRYIEPAPRYIAPRRVYRGLSQAHVNWCFDRYRSYRAYDNTFQPYNGPRQHCWSPYS